MLIYISSNVQSHNSPWRLTLAICTKHSQWTYSNMLSLQLWRCHNSPICQSLCLLLASACVCTDAEVCVWKTAANFIVNNYKWLCISPVETEGDSTIQTLWQTDSVQQHCDNSWPQQDSNSFVCVCVCFWERQSACKEGNCGFFHDSMCSTVTLCVCKGSDIEITLLF